MKRRVLLKLSGEALAGEKHTGFDEPTVTKVAKQVKTLVDQGIEVGYRNRRRKLLERTQFRKYRPYQSRPDRYAGNRYELYLCIRNLVPRE